jgi:pimeloyl-ACP methyl ester carboxylesterase
VNTAHDDMLVDLDVDRRVVEVDGIATSIITSGTGRPLVLLHGGIECGGAMWAPVITSLATENHVVVPDVPGLGESAAADHLDVETFSSWFLRLLDALDLERPAVVAHSLVGSLMARFASRDGDVLGNLVIYAAPAVGPYRMPWRLRYVAVRFAIRPTEANAERFDRFALVDIDATRSRDPAWYSAFVRYTLSRARVRHVKRTMNQLVVSQTKPMSAGELERITVPTSLLWGRQDRMVPLAIGQHAAELQGWPLHIIDDAAHAPHIEQPERFLAALKEIGL